MLINLWTVPRSGSVWYTFHLARQYENSMALFALFERITISMYKVNNPDGSSSYIRNYQPGAYYIDHYLDENNFIKRQHVYAVRPRSVKEEEQYNFDLIKSANPNQVLILNNHIDPIKDEIRDYLMENADQNIWMYRRNVREQLASLVIALARGKFTIYEKSHAVNEIVEDCDPFFLARQMDRIRVWDNFPKGQQEVIAFEDIKFYDAPGFPVAQAGGSWNRISDRMKSVINELVKEYEDSKKVN